MSRIVFEQAHVVDGEHQPCRGATVVVEGKRIVTVSSDAAVTRQPGDRLVDLAGRTVMPGLITCHFHATYRELGRVLAPFGLEDPPALQAARAAKNLELALQCGFTGVVSAGAPHGIDAAMKMAIAEGTVRGPRLIPGSLDVSTTGHTGDRSFPWYWQVGALGAVRLADGPDEFRKAVREEIKRGAEIIKMFVTGGHGTIGPRQRIEMTRSEMAAAIEAAHERGAMVRGHIANREAILMAVDCGIDVIDHADGMDEHCIERIVEAGTYVVPSQLFPHRFGQHLEPGLGFGESMQAEVKEALGILGRANEAGMRLLIGDDYGAVSFPHGRYADELAFYADEAGIAPLDVIRWATMHGSQLMRRSDEVGTVAEGKRADLLIVDGDPVSDLSILADQERLLAVLKDGTFVTDHLAGVVKEETC